MKTSRKVGLAALALASFGLLARCGPYSLQPSEALLTEAGARDFAERQGGKFLACSGQDSDGDSYVTCTVDKGGKEEELLCSYASRGCKKK